MCDLPLTLKGSEIETRLGRLQVELENAGLRLRPHAWLSDEWFLPDGVAGLAIPFYLVHPRSERLEKKEMLEAEGAGERECMKILRHEAGHAVDNAYRLHFRREWQRLFGSVAAQYPNHYTSRANSRRFVLHLNNWYAQTHPAEDFAETFAVWLTPNSRWRQNYARWPALRKLEYVDRLIGELEGVVPPVRKRNEVRPLRSLKHTLERHYERRKSHYLRVTVDFYTRDLRRLFAPTDKARGRQTAAAVLRSLRTELRETVAFWTGIDKYTVNQVIDGMIARARDLRLRLTVSRAETERNLAILVTKVATNMIHSGRNPVAL